MKTSEIKEKMLENLKGCTYNITHTSAAKYSTILDFENWYQMKGES